ncbi:MAG: glycosyltransferase family A protein [Actinomycetota bacterium]|nr:glycosyltransferase family A protein [Actinomycetota bacterium]
MTHDLQVLWMGRRPGSETPLVPVHGATAGGDVAVHCFLLGEGGAVVTNVAATGGELWTEQDFVVRGGVAQFLVEFIASRRVDVLHLHSGRASADLLPAICRAFPDLEIVASARFDGGRLDPFTEYLHLRYAGLISGYLVGTRSVTDALVRRGVPEDVIRHIPDDGDHERKELITSFYRSITTRRSHRDTSVSPTSSAAAREDLDLPSTADAARPRRGGARLSETRMTRRVTSATSARVSVVMPFFDHAAFVEEAIGSIRSQTRPVDEIIVVDDGSRRQRSDEVLTSLVDSGVSVIRQEHRGPSAARNTGAAASSGEAIFFLDSDDMMPSTQIGTALETLAAAPADVGFVYPDFEIFGDQERIVEMPPYNLYLLMLRNFCGMGCLVDRGVFDIGCKFSEDLVGVHEDWDFFLTLGAAGIHGVPNHAARLRYRHHATSRRKLIQEAEGDGRKSVASVHPELFGDASMIEVKRSWAPALSIVTSSPELVDAEGQSCADFEVLFAPGVGAMPQARGRWIVVVGPAGMDGFSDPGFVERLIRLALCNPDMSAFGLAHLEPGNLEPGNLEPGSIGRADLEPADIPIDRRSGWHRNASEPGHAAAVVINGAAYAHWRLSARLGPDGLDPVLEDLVRTQGITDWWRLAPGPIPPVVPAPHRIGTFAGTEASLLDPGLPPDNDSQNSEAHFRWSEPAPVFLPKDGLRRIPIPPRGYRDGAHAIAEGAWAHWKPESTVRLDLVRRLDGCARLEAVDDVSGPQVPNENELRVSLGRVWTEPLRGTACLAAGTDQLTNAPVYRVTNDPTLSAGELPVAYVFDSPVDDAVELAGAFERAYRSLASQIPSTTAPVLRIETGKALIDGDCSVPAHRATSTATGRFGAQLTESRTWLPLYEIALDGHRFRYSAEPDDCMLSTGSIRRTAMTVAQIATPWRAAPAAGLFEAASSDGGGTWYVSRSELLRSGEQLVESRLIGGIAHLPGLTSPLVRLIPGSPALTPVGEPGHRLAVDWRSLVHRGYQVEGTIGHARVPDPELAPLYRWSEVATGRTRLTLGDCPSGTGQSWRLDGTLGMAWRPGCARTGLADLWEMARGEEVAYTVQPELFEANGYQTQRIVASVSFEMSPDLLPLIWAEAPRAEHSFATVSDREATLAGYEERRVIGYIRPLSLPLGSTTHVLTSVPESWVCLPGPDGLPASGAWVACFPFPDCVPMRTLTADPTALEVGGSEEDEPTTSFVGYASSRLVPYARPVFEVETDDGHERWLSLTLPPGARVTGVRCYAFGRPSDHLVAHHGDRATDEPAVHGTTVPFSSVGGTSTLGEADRTQPRGGSGPDGSTSTSLRDRLRAASWRIRRQRQQP